MNVFEKIVGSTMTKAPWDTLVQYYGGDASLKKEKIQYL